MINISWAQFSQNQEAKDISFESFCYQVAYILYKEYGHFENFYNTPGSEFYLTLFKDCEVLDLKVGSKIGWQVKWWFNSEDNSSLNAKNKVTLIENFKTTLKYHPNIKLWIICTPGSFVEKEYNKLVGELKKLSSDTEFLHWNKSNFQNIRSNNYEQFHALFNHYFNTNFIGYNFIETYSRTRIKNLEKKYDTDLYVPSEYDEQILFFLDFRKIYHELELRIKYLTDDIKEIENDSLYRKNDYSSFDKEYIATAYQLLERCVQESKIIIEIVSSKLNIDKTKYLLEQLSGFSDYYSKVADFLNNKLQNKEHIISEKNRLEVYHHDNYVVYSINKIREQILYSKNNQENKSIFTLLKLIIQKNVNILSSAGYGKTNIACNICNTLLNKKIPALLFLGSSFRKIDFPQNIMREILEINNDYNFKELLQALNTLGMIKGFKIPIIIDGLNESNPYDHIWKGNIENIIKDIDSFDYLTLITTCRDRYIESIFGAVDIGNIPNTEILKGFGDNIKEKAIENYFKKYKIQPISWDFNKDVFTNPLLLRIFSEVNANKTNIRISLDNLFNSIDEYIKKIEEKVSQTKSRVDPILKGRVHQRIEEYCRTLWNKNVREIPLDEFHKIIDPDSPTFNDSTTEKLLDEGLCFQKNLVNNIETVQFTFDLIGGYAIANNVIINQISFSNNDLEVQDISEIESKLFVTKNEHPLRQDILNSCIHLFQTEFEVNLFEVFDNDIVLQECINSISYYIGFKDAQHKLIKKILSLDKTSRSFSLVFEKLFENIYKKRIPGLEQLLIDILMNLSQSEIDIYWSEQIRKNFNDSYTVLENINKSYKENNPVNRSASKDFYHSFLATTSSDKSIRSVSTENLYLLVKTYPDDMIKFSQANFGFHDINSIESIIIALCGSVLFIKDMDYTKKIIDLISNKFVPSFKSTHITIIDYIHSILEFGKSNFGIIPPKAISFNTDYFDCSFDQKVINEYSDENEFFSPHLFGISLYEFNKYQLNDIATDEDEKRKTYTRVECLSILSNNIRLKGFREENFSDIHSDFQNDRRYKFNRKTKDNLTLYSEKYLWQSYYEFVGYLFLTNKLISNSTCRYRCDDLFFDPTFPRLPKKFQIINSCYFPSESDDVQSWINSKSLDSLKRFLIHDLFTDKEWVLLSLYLVQEGKSNNTRVEFFIDSYLINKGEIKQKINANEVYFSPTEYSHIFSGEINWSPFFNLNYKELLEKYGLLETTNRYTWSAWSFNRYENPHFKFLSPAISRMANLKFQSEGLYYYNENNEPVTRIVKAKDSELYYVRKDTLEEILEKLQLELLWDQLENKYGEWGKDKKRSLDPSYNSLKTQILYSDLK